MAGHRPWSEIKATASPEVIERAAAKTERMLAVMDLSEIARERGLTQEALAERLDLAQSSVSRALRRTDMHVSTLRDVIEAMGGELVLTAHFPDRDVRLSQFEAGED
jgi:DNA-binding phage protein